MEEPTEKQEAEIMKEEQENKENLMKNIADSVITKLRNNQSELIQSIRNIKNEEDEQDENEQLTEEIKEENKAKIEQITIEVLEIENKLRQTLVLQHSTQINTENEFLHTLKLSCSSYKPTQEEIISRYNELVLSPNDSTWTDATQSQADEDEILMLDDDIMQAMEDDYYEEGEEIAEKKEEEEQVENIKDEIDIDQLEQQFIIGQESDHNLLFGKHDKFCVSLNGLSKSELLVSGGGDDYLFMYRYPKEETSKDKCLHPYHMVKHTETINKIEISYTNEFIFTMTDNEILCTEIETQQTTTLKSRQPTPKTEIPAESESQPQEEDPICSDMVCHHLGDVIAVSSGYELEVYNIKGLKLYQTYYCDKMIDMINFTETGKQIVLACEDNKLRLLTPKTGEIITVSGVKQHKSELSVMKTKGDIILTGCIDGYIGITSIKKSTLTTLIGTKETEDIEGSINNLEFAGNYFMAGTTSDNIDWYDLNKAKRLFQSPINGSSSDICWQGSDYQNIYNVSTINGTIHLFDHRNPLKETANAKAGNTIHKLWCSSNNIVAACEDGHVRSFDIRKLL